MMLLLLQVFHCHFLGFWCVKPLIHLSLKLIHQDPHPGLSRQIELSHRKAPEFADCFFEKYHWLADGKCLIHICFHFQYQFLKLMMNQEV